MTAHSHSPQTRRTAPLGVKLFCIVGFLAALYLVFLSFGLMGHGEAGVTFGFLFLGLAVGYIVVLYGLWMLEPWGWTLGMVIFTFDLLMDLVRVDGVGIVISIILIAYLASKRPLYKG